MNISDYVTFIDPNILISVILIWLFIKAILELIMFASNLISLFATAVYVILSFAIKMITAVLNCPVPDAGMIKSKVREWFQSHRL